jgi:hypothetical protein
MQQSSQILFQRPRNQPPIEFKILDPQVQRFHLTHIGAIQELKQQLVHRQPLSANVEQT